MSPVDVLAFLAREFRGSVMTVSSLSAFVAAEKAADRLAMTAVSREAAQLAVLLPSVPLDRISREFGSETADIVGALRPGGPFSRIALEAMTVHGKSGNDKVRRDAAIAVCAAEAAVLSREDRESFAKRLEDMAKQEAEPERREFLTKLGAELPTPVPADPGAASRGRTSVISISMDVCGATEAKARMRAQARSSEELAEWYEAFHRQFLLSEWRFYSLLFQDGPNGGKLDWHQAFVVKGIGDEIWLLYKVREDDLWQLTSLAVRLFHAALEVAGRSVQWTPASDDDEPGDRPWETGNLPLKFYMDILESTFEISGPRRKFAMEHMPDILGAEESPISEDFIELGSRLNAGNLVGDGRRLITSPRTDYIGWEVDRFFRANKFALPNVVTVGQALFEKIFEPAQEAEASLNGTVLQDAVIKCPIGQVQSTRRDLGFRCVRNDIAPEYLKGVGEGYSVYRILRGQDLLRLRDTGADAGIMAETFDVFTPEMARAERERHRTGRDE